MGVLRIPEIKKPARGRGLVQWKGTGKENTIVYRWEGVKTSEENRKAANR